MLPNPLLPQDSPETRLAYRLQDTATEDPALLPDLIQHAAGPLWRVASLLTNDSSRLVARTLVHALQNRNTFWGNERIDHWLIGILLHHWADSQPQKISNGGRHVSHPPEDFPGPKNCAPVVPKILTVTNNCRRVNVPRYCYSPLPRLTPKVRHLHCSNTCRAPCKRCKPACLTCPPIGCKTCAPACHPSTGRQNKQSGCKREPNFYLT